MKSLTDLGLSTAERDQLLSGLYEGRYNLLLGAGASYGALGSDGVELKDGETLSLQIAAQFALNLNSDERKKLPLTYEEAEFRDKAGLQSWLRRRFTGCQPTWQPQLFKFRWERIWTFNIDDVLDNSFESNRASNVHDDFISIDWKEKLKPLDSTPNSIQVVYLHGRASDLGGPLNGLIFSTGEYSQATRAFQQWHASFQTNYLEKPFIVCGASLAEEVDIAAAIREKNQSIANGIPSFLVSFNLDGGQVDRMRRLNLVPVICPLPDFFSILRHELTVYEKSLQTIASRLKPGTYERFLSQFRRLDTKDGATSAIEGTDFYGGDEPTWNDILQNYDAQFAQTVKAAGLLNKSVDRFAALLHGHSVSGKSVSLFRIAKAAMQQGYKPFLFRHQDGFHAESVADYLAADESAIVLVDDAASYLEAIGKTLILAKKSGTKARIFLTLRTPRIRGFRMDIQDEFRQEFRLGALNVNDLVNFVKKRRRATRLGKHVGESDSKIIKSLAQKCQSELLDCVSYIEFSEPIRERVREIVLSTMKTDDQRTLFAQVACVHRFGFSLPIRVALVSSSLQFNDFRNLLDGHLKTEGILVRDLSGIRLRHRILSEYAWTDSLSIEERYAAMSAITSALAPLINPDVIKSKSLEHILLREILDQEHVSKSIGSKALSFYEEHETVLGWSSRYWDQRALLESRIEGHFPKAYSYSQKAISLESHPFAYTSLGTICMRYCGNVLENNRMDAMKFFYEGEEALSKAWSLSAEKGRPYEHPFVTFFASATSLLKKTDPKNPEFESVLQLFRIWLQRAKDSSVFKTSQGQKRIKDVQATEIKESLRMKTGSDKKKGFKRHIR